MFPPYLAVHPEFTVMPIVAGSDEYQYYDAFVPSVAPNYLGLLASTPITNTGLSWDTFGIDGASQKNDGTEARYQQHESNKGHYTSPYQPNYGFPPAPGPPALPEFSNPMGFRNENPHCPPPLVSSESLTTILQSSSAPSPESLPSLATSESPDSDSDISFDLDDIPLNSFAALPGFSQLPEHPDSGSSATMEYLLEKCNEVSESQRESQQKLASPFVGSDTPVRNYVVPATGISSHLAEHDSQIDRTEFPMGTNAQSPP